MKKIGIVTYHHVINDGAILQALAQQEAFQAVYPDYRVEIIDFRYKVIEGRERMDILKDLIKLRPSFLTKFRKYRLLKKFVRESLVLSSVRFTSDSLTEISDYINSNYDAVVVGSDEVWKVDHNKYSRPFPNLYWLPFPIKVKKIASAATANTLKVDKLSPGELELMRKLLEAFKLIGVRDRFTEDLVRDLKVKTPLRLMPDPTFGLKLREEVFKKVERKFANFGIDLTKPIIALSLSSNIVELGVLSKSLFEHFSRNKIQVVTIGQFNRYSHFNLAAELNPLEWAHAYRFFAMCITDRFHSTIFSIRNHVPFVSLDFSNRYQGSDFGKIADLLVRLGLENHHLRLKRNAHENALQSVLDICRFDVKEVTDRLRLADSKMTQDYMEFVENSQNYIRE